MEILSPVWPAAPAARPPKRRPARLDGVAVALVDDNMDWQFTTHLEAALAAGTGAKVTRWVKPSGTAPAPAALVEEAAAQAAVAVVGIGL
jgi:hypothetical protein